MSDEKTNTNEIESDNRPECKYGEECYQKNELHRKKYKHPPRKYYEERMKPEIQSKAQGDGASTSEKVSPKQVQTNRRTPEKQITKKPRLDFHWTPPKNPRTKKDSPPHTIEDPPDKDPRKFIKTHFLVDMPEDFYLLWDFVKILKPSNPLEAFNDIDLILVGPYDVLAGKFNKTQFPEDEYLRHWRYYYDPPEFQTIIAGSDKTGFHMGYFRDTPGDLPAFVAGNRARKDGIFKKLGDNIFGALRNYLLELRSNTNPFKRIKIDSLLKTLTTRAQKSDLSIEENTEKIRKRDVKSVTKTLNKLGLVVPYDKKTQLGYRPLTISDIDLMRLMEKFQFAVPEDHAVLLSHLQQTLTYVDIAIDECDFGTGIKLGWDLLYYGVDTLNNTIARYLGTAYRLLRRDAFASIIEAHMKRRIKEGTLSIIG